ncbi:DegV family protein with EDD domain [Paenibacillus sp. BK033]|uniref:DegV family protein n=1 Tax=Paenibacillus sp. BK033 TaxID=2512133 RepID=UPI001042EE84|nr:DegV family protein [Paenibacillus sp. BK033]TCM99318.1 DegV family protein with EDD domain [Paenibacillus sp. BK033]
MPGIRIVTDSTTDLPKELLDQHEVEVIPLSVYVDGETYEDNVTIFPLDFIQKMKMASELPKTSQPAVGVFLDTYDRLGKNGDTIISIHMTSGLSGTFASASAAAEMSASNVVVIDSQMISQALGFQVIEAAKLAKEGHTAQQIKARLKSILENTSLLVVVDTLENLVKGGRIGKAKGWISSVLSIKPIAMLQEGVYTPIAKVRTSSQIIKSLMERFKSDTEGKEITEIGISHADNLSLAERLREEISRITATPVRIRPATPVITTHTGPGAIGFMYCAE